jgi:hypothetical protein
VAKQGYDAYESAMYAPQSLNGLLSDIAGEVTAIPLQPAGNGQRIENVRGIRRVGDDLFLISGNTLYRYHCDGRFICRISRPEEIQVASYVVNPSAGELIVTGNEDDVFFYTFNGEPKGRKKLANHSRILSLSMHNDRILTVEESLYTDKDTGVTRIEKELIVYDTAFEQLGSRKMAATAPGRSQYVPPLSAPRFCVDPGSGKWFAFSPSLDLKYLLQDTLYLQRHFDGILSSGDREGVIPCLPVCPAGRFWLSSYHNPENGMLDYTFCYDSLTRRHIQVSGGFRDDFYRTGEIPALEPVDPFNRSFAFSRSGEAIKKAFPHHADAGNAVVFIVRLKEA